MVKREEFIRLLLSGCSIKECAAALGHNYNTMLKYARMPDFMLELRSRNNKVWEKVDEELGEHRIDKMERLLEASELALEQMISLATTSQSDVIRFKAAQDLMDRDVAISRTQRSEKAVDHRFINPLVLQAAQKAADEEEKWKERIEEEKRKAIGEYKPQPTVVIEAEVEKIL